MARIRHGLSRWTAAAVTAWFVVLVLGATGLAQAPQAPAKNVILLIGDGMAAAERTLAYYYAGYPPVMNQLPVVGLFTTHMAEGMGYVTDSAAAATSMACGIKTYDGAIGVGVDKQPCRTILEAARDAGKATGLVATSRINHATPAGFAAHDESRDNYDAIMADFLETRVDVIFGGGLQYTLPASAGGSRKDGRDLLREFREAGYAVVTSPAELATAGHLPVLGLFAKKDMAPELDRDPAREPSLAEMTRKAIGLLSQDPEGFFLMVEGSQIDWAGHANDAAYNASDTMAFDEAVAAAVAFAATHPGTLVLVTADHETGLLGIGDQYHFDPVALRRIRATYGRIASLIADDRSNAASVLRQYAGIGDLTSEELRILKETKDKQAAVTVVLNKRVGVLWGSPEHNAVMIPMSAYGAGAEHFAGFYDNTDVAKKMAQVMGLSL